MSEVQTVQTVQLQHYDPMEDLVMYRKIHARRAERENKLAAKNEIMKMRLNEVGHHVPWDEIACGTFMIALLIGLALQFHIYLRLVNITS
jgi:hypothetical protein